MSLALATMSVWVLFKTQLDILEGTTRSMTDMLWSGSRRIRKWRGGDVRLVYYTILVAAVIWGLIALRLTQPIILLQLGANVAGLVMVISAIHILYVNTKLLPRELKPPMWRRPFWKPSACAAGCVRILRRSTLPAFVRLDFLCAMSAVIWKRCRLLENPSWWARMPPTRG